MIAITVPIGANAQTRKMTVKETVRNFGEAVNAHDISHITALLTNDHIFIDATGKEVNGKGNTTTGWGDLFKSFPDYHIEMKEIFANGDTVAAFGFVEGSYKGVKENHCRIPTSWKAIVQGQQIKLLQVYGDTKLHSDIIAKNNPGVETNNSPRVTGIGGLFFKSKDPKNLREWYKQHLHMDAGPYGAKFDWRQGDDPSKYGCTQWTIFGEKTTYFAPSTKDFMINYRVNNLTQLVEQLEKEGVTLVDTIQDSDYGKFIHILDCEQNKVELWEPKVEDYNTKVGGGK